MEKLPPHGRIELLLQSVIKTKKKKRKYEELFIIYEFQKILVHLKLKIRNLFIGKKI